jgi:D-alanyl-D-alanine carboxypeptidase
VQFCSTVIRACVAAALAAGGIGACIVPAAAEALLVIEADSGKVLHADHATYPWHPASVTKLMTAYVTLRAVKENRISLDRVLSVSPNAVAQQPSKMGFQAGTQVTVDNALKMLMVKSANDMAVVLAEGVSGSVENFADEMNRTAAHLDMVQSHFVNPNGLPADEQVTSARDLAILARALIREFPEYGFYWNIGAIKFGRRTMRNHNSLIVRYPGADGMKTGFICASGFNLVASATRGNRRLIAVVLGAPSSAVRAVKAAQLLESGFNRSPLAWLTPSLGTVDKLAPINATPPNMREEMCGKHRKRPAAESVDDEEEASPNADSGSQHTILNLRPANGKPSQLLHPPSPVLNPVVVYVGPAKRPDEVAALNAAAAKAAANPPAKKKAAKKAAEKQAAPKSTAPAAPASIIAPEKKTKATAAPASIIAPEKKAKAAPAAAPKTAATPAKQVKPKATSAAK